MEGVRNIRHAVRCCPGNERFMREEKEKWRRRVDGRESKKITGSRSGTGSALAFSPARKKKMGVEGGG